jgi:polysaccharide chain length determinant protein (PEP-CTERM system associated)
VSSKNSKELTESKNFTIRDYAEIFWRRKWWFVIPVFIGVSVSTIYSYSLPSIYKSSTLILVEPQKIPESYVHPTVTSSVEDRLNTISQQILSRTNLEKIITEYGLYKESEIPNKHEKGYLSNIVDKFRDAGNLLAKDQSNDFRKWNPAENVDRMRQSIEISVLGGRRQKNAFTVSYSGKDPSTVMNVTNALASLFIEENLKVRERQAEGTSAFLSSELAAAERELKEVEKNLKTFKERHNGSLPDQLDANLKTLDRFNLDNQNLSDEIRRLEERKIFYEQQLSSIEVSNAPKVVNVINESTLEKQLSDLQLRLSKLRSEFTDSYPDVVILRDQIRDLEGKISESKPQIESQKIESTSASEMQIKRLNDLSGQIKFVSTEIETLKDRRAKMLNLIKEYERRIESTYQNEMELSSLVRDYDISKANYETLLSKKLNAKMSENLEKRQQGEQFKVIDPANLPINPYMPNRMKITLIGSLCSGILGAGLILLFEYLYPYFRKPEDFQQVSALPLLSTIPKFRRNLKNRNFGVVSIDDPNSIITEQYRVLYAKLNDISERCGSKVFAITSPIRGDGKTLTALNIAVVMARDFGKKILLLEGDFKTPSLVKFIKHELQSDLVDMLLSRNSANVTSIPFSDTLIPFADDNLSILPAAKSVSNSSGLVSSQSMKMLLQTLKEQYDYVIIDAPPILPLSDMSIFEEVVDGIVIVVRAEKTPKSALIRSLDTIDNKKIFGLILNEFREPLPKYYQYPYKDFNIDSRMKVNL